MISSIRPSSITRPSSSTMLSRSPVGPRRAPIRAPEETTSPLSRRRAASRYGAWSAAASSSIAAPTVSASSPSRPMIIDSTPTDGPPPASSTMRGCARRMASMLISDSTSFA